MDAIAAMAQWSMMETQIENLLIARDFADCVAYMTDDGVTVAVPAPAEGLSEADVARITETITAETDYDASQLRVIEIKPGTAQEEGVDASATADDALAPAASASPAAAEASPAA